MKAATDKETQTLLDKRLLKVLLVDDEATDRIPVERILRTCSSPAEFVVESAVCLSEAIKNLTEKQFDVVLLDLELPDSSGIEILQQVIKVAPDIPVVVLTELDDEQTGFSALEDGATDYLVKDLPLDVVLVRTIIYALQRKKIQMHSLKLTHDINERMKELNCLYGISKLVETPGISLEEILEKTVCLIPAGWQYPGIACARIVFEGREYKTDSFKPSKWTQSADIKLQGQKVGTVEVCYMEERPQSDEGMFLEEKRDLINAIGERLGKMAERIKGEEALRETNSYLDNLFNYANAPIIVWSPQFKITRFNHAFELLTGRSAGEVLGQTLDLLFSPAQVQPTMELIRKALGGERWQTVEIEILHLDGTVRTVLWNSATIFDSDGKTPVATIAQGHDITERKQAEEALKESKERLELALSAASMGTWRWNIKTDQDTRDASFNSMLGLKATESTQSVKDFIQYVHPDDRAAVDEEIKRAIRERDIYRFEFRIVRPDGTIYWLSDRGKVYYDQKNDPAYMTGAVFNITERKQAEELLWESQEQYRALVENTAIGITVIDTHYKIITANTMLSKLFNRPASDFVGKNCFREYEKREAVCPHCPGVRAMASGNTEEVETQGVRDDGSRFYVRNRAVPLVGPDGVMKGFIELVEDVTERRNKEKLILDANRRLEKVSEELSAAKRDLEQKNEALQKVCSELQQRVKEQTAQLAAANRSLGDKGYYK